MKQEEPVGAPRREGWLVGKGPSTARWLEWLRTQRDEPWLAEAMAETRLVAVNEAAGWVAEAALWAATSNLGYPVTGVVVDARAREALAALDARLRVYSPAHLPGERRWNELGYEPVYADSPEDVPRPVEERVERRPVPDWEDREAGGAWWGAGRQPRLLVHGGTGVTGLCLLMQMGVRHVHLVGFDGTGGYGGPCGYDPAPEADYAKINQALLGWACRWGMTWEMTNGEE